MLLTLVVTPAGILAPCLHHPCTIFAYGMQARSRSKNRNAEMLPSLSGDLLAKISVVKAAWVSRTPVNPRCRIRPVCIWLIHFRSPACSSALSEQVLSCHCSAAMTSPVPDFFAGRLHTRDNRLFTVASSAQLCFCIYPQSCPPPLPQRILTPTLPEI